MRTDASMLTNLNTDSGEEYEVDGGEPEEGALDAVHEYLSDYFFFIETLTKKYVVSI